MKKTLGFSLPIILAFVLVILIISGVSFLDRVSANSVITISADPKATGGPDLFGYTFRDSSEPDGPVFKWEDISNSGTLIEGWCDYDDCFAGPFPIGFDFNYYGSNFSEFFVSTNGYISFGQGWGDIPWGKMPGTWDPNNDIGLFGGDMYLADYGSKSRVYYQTLSNPTRLVLEYVNLYYCCEYTAPHTFEVILYADGDILSQYSTLYGTSTGYVGIENSDGSDGLGYDASLVDELAIRYYYPIGVFLTPSAQQGIGNPGEKVPYTLQLSNLSGMTDSFELDLLPGNTWTTTLSADLVGPIEHGESDSLTITVTVPVNAPWYDTDNATILATGVTSPSLTANAQITTTAFATAQIWVEPDSLHSTQLVGEVTTQTMTISNGGGVTLTYDMERINQGNVLALHLNEPVGVTTFHDTSGYGNNATCFGDTCPAAGVPGKIGNAVSFDGVDDYIQIPHNTEFDEIEDQDKLTIAAWVWVNNWFDEYFFMIINQYESDLDNGWEFYIDPNDLKFAYWYHYDADSCPFNFNTHEWYHVAMSYDRNLGTIQYYVNNNQICNHNFSGDIQETSGEPMYIGYSPTGGQEYSDGFFDEVYIFNRALSAEEIMAIYQHEQGRYVSWLEVSPISGTVQINASIPIQVTFDATDLKPGMSKTTLYIYNNDPHTPIVEIPITLTTIPGTTFNTIYLPMAVKSAIGGKREILRIASDDEWRVSANFEPGWELVDFDDSDWGYTVAPAGNCATDYCWDDPNSVLSMWSFGQEQIIYLRKSFVLDADIVSSATIWSRCDDDHDLYINGELVASDWDGWAGPKLLTDIASYLNIGVNTLAIKASDTNGNCRSMCVDATITLINK